MKVTNELQGLEQIVPAREIAKAGAAGQAQGTAGSAAADEATLSSAASLAAQAAPDSDVRMEKVVQVQQAMATGSYDVPASDVANKMIERMLGK